MAPLQQSYPSRLELLETTREQFEFLIKGRVPPEFRFLLSPSLYYSGHRIQDAGHDGQQPSGHTFHLSHWCFQLIELHLNHVPSTTTVCRATNRGLRIHSFPPPTHIFFIYILHSTLILHSPFSVSLPHRSTHVHSYILIQVHSAFHGTHFHLKSKGTKPFALLLAQAWLNYETSVCVPWTGPLDQQEQREKKKAAFGFVPSFHAPKKRKKKSESTDRGREASTTQRGRSKRR